VGRPTPAHPAEGAITGPEAALIGKDTAKDLEVEADDGQALSKAPPGPQP